LNVLLLKENRVLSEKMITLKLVSGGGIPRRKGKGKSMLGGGGLGLDRCCPFSKINPTKPCCATEKRQT